MKKNNPNTNQKNRPQHNKKDNQNAFPGFCIINNSKQIILIITTWSTVKIGLPEYFTLMESSSSNTDAEIADLLLMIEQRCPKFCPSLLPTQFTALTVDQLFTADYTSKDFNSHQKALRLLIGKNLDAYDAGGFYRFITEVSNNKWTFVIVTNIIICVIIVSFIPKNCIRCYILV